MEREMECPPCVVREPLDHSNELVRGVVLQRTPRTIVIFAVEVLRHLRIYKVEEGVATIEISLVSFAFLFSLTAVWDPQKIAPEPPFGIQSAPQGLQNPPTM